MQVQQHGVPSVEGLLRRILRRASRRALPAGRQGTSPCFKTTRPELAQASHYYYNSAMNERPEENNPVQPEKLSRKIKRDLWETVKIVIISLAIVVPIRYFVVQPFIVRGASMEPNFEDKEYLIIDELSFYVRQPERGEVIVFRYPKDPKQFFIKRIIGLPGEKVEIRNSRVKIFNENYPKGFTLSEPYLNPPDRPTRPSVSLTLEANEYFVLGDNRDYSSDSRIWGPLSKNRIVGRVIFRAWPLDRIEIFTN